MREYFPLTNINMNSRIKYFCLFFLICLIFSQNDYINHRKYWYYKSRMLNDFMKVGLNQGDNLIFNERGLGCTTWNNPSCNYFKIGDATSTLGHYLAILSTEYALLKLNNQPTDSVLYQLYCALYTLNRLDFTAEKILGCNSNGILNGFIARDDMPSNYVQNNFEHFNYYGDKGFMSNFTYPMVNVESDYYNHYEKNNNTWDNSPYMFQSQDQIYAMLYGLMHVIKFVNPLVYAKDKNNQILYFQDNEKYIFKEAQKIIKRIVEFSEKPKNCSNENCGYTWQIVYPTTCLSLGQNVGAGFTGGTFAYPMAEINCRSQINDFFNYAGWCSTGIINLGPSACGCASNPYHTTYTQFTSFTLWKNLTDLIGLGASGNIFYYAKLFSGFLGSVCDCMYYYILNFNFTSQFLDKISVFDNNNNQSYYYYYNIPYSHAILFNKNVNDNSAITPFIDVINYMNPCVHFDFGNGNFGNPAWATDTRIEHIERLNNDEFLGEYPGYDYLLYHNLWYLYHKIKGTNGINTTMYDFSNPYINLNGLAWPGPLPFNISLQIPLKLDYYENLKVENTRFHLKNNEYGYIRSGKSIDLKPGTYITYKSNYNPNIFNVNCGVRLYTERYYCADDWGTFDDNSNIRLTNQESNNYWPVMDSIIGNENNINEEYLEFLKNNFKSNEGKKESFYTEENIIIYPNPFNNSINVSNSSGKNLIIYDIFGKVYLSKELISNEEYLDMSAYPSGVYFFKIGEKVFKIVKN